MKKVLVSFLTLFMVAGFSSCGSDSDDPHSDGYAYVAVLNGISDDLIQYYNVKVEMVVPGQSVYTTQLTSTKDWQFGRVSNVKGVMSMTVTCTPKNPEAFVDDQSYTISLWGGLGFGKVTDDTPSMRITSLFDMVTRGSTLKKKGTLSTTVTIND